MAASPPPPRRRSARAAPSLTPEALPAVTVPPLRNGVGSFASASMRGGARMLVAVDDQRIALPLRDRHRRDLAGETAVRPARPPPWPGSPARRRSWSSRETEQSSATFSPVSGIESTPYCAFDQRIDEAPADGGVVDLGMAREGALSGLRQHEGRAATCSRRRRR